MAFASGFLADPQRVGSGERFGDNVIVLGTPDFGEGLFVGRFAQLVGTEVINMAAGENTVVAGVVLRNVAAAVEANGVIDKSLTSAVEYVRSGLVTVDLRDGDVPLQFAPVFADVDGKASTAGVETGAEFIREEQAGVWLVRLK